MQPLAVSNWQFERPVIRCQDQDISRRIQDCRADFAVLQVAFDVLAQLRVDAPVDVLRDVLPNVFALEFHSALPKNPLRAGAVVFR